MPEKYKVWSKFANLGWIVIYSMWNRRTFHELKNKERCLCDEKQTSLVGASVKLNFL